MQPHIIINNLIEQKITEKEAMSQLTWLSYNNVVALISYYDKNNYLFKEFTPKESNHSTTVSVLLYALLRPQLFDGIVLPEGYKNFTQTTTNALINCKTSQELLRVLASCDQYLGEHFGPFRGSKEQIQTYQATKRTPKTLPKIVVEDPRKYLIKPYQLKCPVCGASVNMRKKPTHTIYCSKDNTKMVLSK